MVSLRKQPPTFCWPTHCGKSNRNMWSTSHTAFPMSTHTNQNNSMRTVSGNPLVYSLFISKIVEEIVEFRAHKSFNESWFIIMLKATPKSTGVNNEIMKMVRKSRVSANCAVISQKFQLRGRERERKNRRRNMEWAKRRRMPARTDGAKGKKWFKR